MTEFPMRTLWMLTFLTACGAPAAEPTTPLPQTNEPVLTDEPATAAPPTPPPMTKPDDTPATPPPVPPTCDDGVRNQDETGADCGASCGGCVADTCFDIGQGTCAANLYCVDTQCTATPREEPECAAKGNPGQCIETTACAALGDHVSTAGLCPGPANIQCCTTKPTTADNPPIPTGWQLMKQAQVATDMSAWAIEILHDTTSYPLFATVLRQFGSLTVLARVQWHPPDFQNGAIHRGVTLFVPVN